MVVMALILWCAWRSIARAEKTYNWPLEHAGGFVWRNTDSDGSFLETVWRRRRQDMPYPQESGPISPHERAAAWVITLGTQTSPPAGDDDGAGIDSQHQNIGVDPIPRLPPPPRASGSPARRARSSGGNSAESSGGETADSASSRVTGRVKIRVRLHRRQRSAPPVLGWAKCKRKFTSVATEEQPPAYTTLPPRPPGSRGRRRRHSLTLPGTVSSGGSSSLHSSRGESPVDDASPPLSAVREVPGSARAPEPQSMDPELAAAIGVSVPAPAQLLETNQRGGGGSAESVSSVMPLLGGGSDDVQIK